MYVKFDISFMEYLNPRHLDSLEQCGIPRRDLLSIAIQTILNVQMDKTLNMNTLLYNLMLTDDYFKEVIFDIAPNIIREQMFKPLVDILSIICCRLEPTIKATLNGSQRPTWFTTLRFSIVDLTAKQLLLNFYIPLPFHE